MKILILTQYYPPETGAPQNRLSALAGWLHAHGHHVEVLTGMPNYPALQLFKGYELLKELTEAEYGYPVHRVRLYLGGKGFLKRLWTYFSFCLNAWNFGRKSWRRGQFDWVFCESPPLFLGLAGKAIARRTGAKLWFNVSDLWPESVEKLGLVKNRLLLVPFYMLEKHLYHQSDFITGQTQGICHSIERRTGKNCHWYPNGIATEEIQAIHEKDIPEEIGLLLSKKVVLYSGNFGYAQGLEVVLGAAELLLDRSDLIFIMIGDGPEKDKLEKIIHEKGLSNVRIFSSIPRNILFGVIRRSFASVVPLRDIELFRGAIPSKIFEPLSLGVPVLLGVEGEAKEIFCNQNGAALFFEPENAESLAKGISTLLNNADIRKDQIAQGEKVVKQTFNRHIIHKELMQILQIEP